MRTLVNFIVVGSEGTVLSSIEGETVKSLVRQESRTDNIEV